MLTALLLRYFTPGPGPQLGLAGSVVDAATSKNIPRAIVRISLGPDNIAANRIVVTALASGYRNFSQTVTLDAGLQTANVRMIPLAPVPVTGPGHIGVIFKPGLTFHVPPPSILRAPTTLVVKH